MRYSDGVYEPRNPAGEAIGISRPLDLLARVHQKDPREILEFVKREVQAFSGFRLFPDDLTALAVKVA